MDENEKLFELEKRFCSVDERLEKQKSKRNLILIGIYSVISGFITSHLFKTIDLYTIFFIIFISLISGIVLWIVPLSIFRLITELFTNIDSLEESKRHLAEEIKRIRRKY